MVISGATEIGASLAIHATSLGLYVVKLREHKIAMNVIPEIV